MLAGMTPLSSAPPPDRSARGGRLRRALHEGWRLLWATPCAACGLHSGAPLCEGCRLDYLDPSAPRCRGCGLRLPQQLPAGDRCGRCLLETPHFDETHALGDYGLPLAGMVMALKFGHRLQIADAFGRLLAERVRACTAPDTPLLPVPLAFERLTERGFNQSLEIARAAARASGRPLWDDVLIRVRHRPAQQALPTLAARRTNLRGAFAVSGERLQEVKGRSVALVDDVMTSGSTLDEAARMLKDAGAARVVNFVVARTP
jgi:ComF family protein